MIFSQLHNLTGRRSCIAQGCVRLLAVLVGLPAALLLTGCQSLDGAGAASGAQIRFVNASRNAGGLDLYMSGTAAAFNLGFASFTSYVAFSPGAYTVNAARANTSQTLVSTHAALAPAHQYTAVITHALSGLTQTVYEDQSTPAPANTIALRVLDVADELGPVDVYLKPVAGAFPGTHRPLASGLRESANSGYLEVPAATSYTVTVVPSGTPWPNAGNQALATVSLEAVPGAVRTLILANSPTKSGGMYAFAVDDLDPA